VAFLAKGLNMWHNLFLFLRALALTSFALLFLAFFALADCFDFFSYFSVFVLIASARKFILVLH
jgi:hypothetical protein